ncbi:LOW QUALITY PROTEIN: cytochrome P450 307a1-like [Drosophila sulfurigaster albostrigata]|uniref:LOW QUALITY PROTEIN: cytochrome P450 307a1-like n=1 Tax=Drosophila sulfurigaster albostrigata TaxID=89887 RepID=UPI002D21D3C3|nr:LOW QUALITY PROTEIN: cytochrome P450 307a1-like [Drosophila sulfurigaster albostrigata]
MIFECFLAIAGIILILISASYINIIYNCKCKVIVKNTLKNGGEIKQKFMQAPGPHPWPIIGNLDIIGRFDNTFEGFGALAQQYGDIYSLTLGHTRCLIVNNLELIREVLNKNGKFFGGRPDFLRYDKLFGGDRNNSLALCNWSQLQKKRRNLARRHCSPRESTAYYTKMSTVGCHEIDELMAKLRHDIVPGKSIDIKPILHAACANMFSQYMCSKRHDYDDEEFKQFVHFFDEIFWEVNQGHPLDFLPWLLPFYGDHIRRLRYWSQAIRQFILERIVNERELNIDPDAPDNDFTDVLLKSLNEDKNMSRNTIIFMLEDFLGGHSAVGNLVMLTLTYIAKDPTIAERIQREADQATHNGVRSIGLHDMDAMPYTMATIYEVLRYSSSPIVPHVATEDSVIAGFGVTKGTIVFINNYVLNMSNEYWKNPEKFEPERFLEIKLNNSEKTLDGRVQFQLRKNLSHFLPFSIGKRTCIGQNLVRAFGFILLTNILLRYDIKCPDLTMIKINPASLALPANCFPLQLTPRPKE